MPLIFLRMSLLAGFSPNHTLHNAFAKALSSITSASSPFSQVCRPLAGS